MKIFQLIDSRNFGGIETHILQLCLFLKDKGFDCNVVFVSKYKKNALRDALIKNNISFLEGDVFNIIRKNKNAVFHSHGYKSNILNKSAKLLFGQKTICSYHSGEKSKGKLWFYEFFDKKSAFLACQNIAISNIIKKQLLSYNVDVEYNFIYKDADYRRDYNVQNISFIGRLSEEKNPSDFFEISKEYKDLNFNIFGTGELKYLIPNKNNIYFYGYIPNQERVWSKTDVLLITSKYEGLPYVLIEAMSRGLIVVSYKVGEIPNIIENEKNGYLVNDLDEMKDVVQKINSLSPSEKDKIRISALKTFNETFGKKAGEVFLDHYDIS